MPKLLMLRWLPASGKSAYAKELEINSNIGIEEKKNVWCRVNKDEIRKCYKEPWSKAQEKKVVEEEDIYIVSYLHEGMNVVVDDTNLNPVHEERLRQIARDEKAQFEIKDFHTPLEECIKRDSLREDSVGEKVIRDMANRWKRYDFSPVIQNERLPNAIIVDIDGTLAGMTDRSPYDYSKVSNDFCHEDIKGLVHILSKNHTVLIFSWRESSCREATKEWLALNKICYHTLLMRPEWDTRNDALVKREMLERIIESFRIRYVFDDRDRVVKMWRQSGLRCLQVAEGTF